MLPNFLVEDGIRREDGVSPALELGSETAPVLLITLGITRIVEQESLDVEIQGSADGQNWTRLLAFPQKFYCGTYSLLLDLSGHPDVRMIRVSWSMNRWGRGDTKPQFGFYVFAEHAATAVGAGQ
jgi:hypothetical protein